jgi:hypothetical protein
MKICPVGAKLLHVDGWADMTKPVLAFCNFVEAPKKKVGRKEKRTKKQKRKRK